MAKKNSDNKVYIETTLLMNLIKELENNNEEIVSKIKDINNKFIDLDMAKWNSPERKKYDDIFIPYIKAKEQSINDNLSNCIKNLNTARNNYVQLENTNNNFKD